MLLERTHIAREGRLEDDALQVFAPMEYARVLRAEKEYAASGRNGVTLMKTPELRVRLEVLRAGEELPRHPAPGPLSIQLLEGALRFHAGEETFRVREGELLVLPAERSYLVEAVRDSAFLIDIAPIARAGEK